MSRKTNTVKVREIPGEPLRYRVESWTDPDHPYTVDFTENQGNGECTCIDFVAYCQPRYLKTGQIVGYGHPSSPNKNRTRCRHIEAAFHYWGNKLLRDLAQHYNGHARLDR
jgi:hypothetical protein